MTTLDYSPLVTTEWLAAHLDDPDLRVVDVRWKSRYEQGRGIGFDDHDGYMKGHIPGAVFARMAEDLSDPQAPFPDALINVEQFSEAMGRLGISNANTVIAYDDTGLPLGAARFWWA